MNETELERLPSVEVADVRKAGVPAATLTRDADGIEFAYRADYLASGGLAVATTLPLTDQPVRTQAGAVPPYFAGLLPEGRRLTSLHRAVKTSADDELSLLLAVGRDTVGDVQVVPEGEDPAPAAPLLQVDSEWSEVRFADVVSAVGVVDRVGLPGIQDKVSAGMISVPVGRAGDRYILKVDPPEYPHVVENEAFFLKLAREVRIESADATVVVDADGRPGLLVRRFDRVADPSGSTIPLASEDACQVLGRWPADKYHLSAEQVVMGLAVHCQARPVALQRLFQQICFAWLTGNGDVHAKNMAILRTSEGEWRVAPAYDLPSTVPYGDKSLALAVQGRTRGVSRRYLLAFADAVGLRERIALRVLDGLLERTEGLGDRLLGADLPFSEEVIRELVAELRFRRRLATT